MDMFQNGISLGLIVAHGTGWDVVSFHVRSIYGLQDTAGFLKLNLVDLKVNIHQPH